MDRRLLDADALRAALGPRWARVDLVAETRSTNADLLARHDAPDRTVLIAELQSAGRGRLDRAWTSPAGAGLTFSVLLRPDAPIATWGWLPLLTGVALHTAVTEFAGVDAALKWPNDLLALASAPASPPREPGLTVGAIPRKVAGILAQTSGEAVVIGVGLNVSTTADELGLDTATSLALSGARDVDRGGLLVAILTALDARVAQWADVGGDAEACGLATAYSSVCATLGRPVSVAVTHGGLPGDEADRPIVGTARSIDSDGRLVVETDRGHEVIGAGDVQHLRPA
ncbi:MAG: biotin--[acetyl-CoA-carboxylase] ligase [Jatrophihabitantaceae bacterium]